MSKAGTAQTMDNRVATTADRAKPSTTEPAIARLLCGILQQMQTPRTRVSMAGRAWRLVLMVPVFGLYLILARWMLWRRRPIEVTSRTEFGSTMLCRPPDLVMMYVHLFGIWEPDISRFIARRVGPGDVFVDVGANVGYYSLLARQSIGSTGAVVSIEASPRIFGMLQANIEHQHNGAPVRAVHVAAGSQRGELAVHLGPEHNLGLTTTSARSDYGCEATVQALPLDEILNDDERPRARLVKIDVEGGEDQVIAGLDSFIRHCPDDVEFIVELTPRWWSSEHRTPAELLRPLFDAGFHAYQLQNNYWPWRYLWSHDVKPPQRVRFDLDRPFRRLDLVLSRVDADEL